jgi:hypothetical protein
MGKEYLPPNIHPSLKRVKNETSDLNTMEPLAWVLVQKDDSHLVEGKLPLINDKPGIKPVAVLTTVIQNEIILSACQWNSVDWSCAYDTVVSILYNLWLTNRQQWKSNFSNRCDILTVLNKCFVSCYSRTNDLNKARDTFRMALHHNNQVRFPLGQKAASVADIMDMLLKNDNSIENVSMECITCSKRQNFCCPNVFNVIGLQSNHNSPEKVLKHNLNMWCSRQPCSIPDCNSVGFKDLQFNKSPNIIAFESFSPSTVVSKSIKIKSKHGTNLHFHLSGLIYNGSNHFVSRYICDGISYFNDGMISDTYSEEGQLKSFSKTAIYDCHDKNLCLVIYSRK